MSHIKIDSDYLHNEKEYFLSFLVDRFTRVSEVWAQALSKKFHKEFIPIYILQAHQCNSYEPSNYMIIKAKSSSNDTIRISLYEELNIRASESKELNQLIDALVKKQNRLFVTVFTSIFLDFGSKNVIILGPSPELSAQFDSKSKQVELFEFLDIPRSNNRVHNSIDDIAKFEKPPFFVYAAHGSGGSSNSKIYSLEDLKKFYSHLSAINRNKPFVAADLIEDISYSVNITSIVINNACTMNLLITDQILKGNAYLGNIFPSKAPDSIVKEIKEATVKVGNYIASLGFRGMFGMDFLVDLSGKLYTVDLNPRHQGGYLCNMLILEPFDLISYELDVHLGDAVFINDIPKVIKPNVFLAWKKIKSNIPYKITKSYIKGSEKLAINGKEIFQCVFYKSGSIIVEGHAGFMIASGDSYSDVENKIKKLSEDMVKDVLCPYSNGDEQVY